MSLHLPKAAVRGSNLLLMERIKPKQCVFTESAKLNIRNRDLLPFSAIQCSGATSVANQPGQEQRLGLRV